jgi:hypothetical protein
LVSASAFNYLLRKSRRDNLIKIFSASITDIDKILKSKVLLNPREKLPAEYYDYLNIFNRILAKLLPPPRPSIDHKIILKKIPDGKDPEIPWNFFYNIFRRKLLVLRKTLTELLNKNFIRASNFPAAAPVLFIKKFNGGLRFYINYRALNALTQKNRYSLPLIKKTLNSFSKVKWFIKLDIIAAFHKIRITEGEEQKITFYTRYGLFE